MTKKKSIFTQEVIVGIIVIALYFIFRGISADFGKYTTFLTLTDISYYYVLMAIGVAFPLITGGVDLSIGTGLICYALAGGYLIRAFSWPTGLAILVSILFGVAIGLANGVLVSIMGLPPFLATLCTCMITRGLGSVVTGSFAVPWPTAKQDNGWFHAIFKMTIVTADGKMKFPLGLVWIILLMLVMQFVLAHTRFGRYTIAIGSNKEAAILSGINVKFYHVMVYAVSGLFAGLASIAYAAYVPTVQPGTGAGMELDAIGGAIVGGVSASGGYGTIYGTVLGAYVIMLLKQGLPYIGLNANMQQIITGFVLIGAVVIDIIKRRAIR
ncbi:MAG: ABC transporter permease [Blautia sp.]|nr:ABC transporter permease [Blautia sp.]